MQPNYLLTYVRRDSVHVMLFCSVLLAAGLSPFWLTTDNALRASGGTAVLSALFGFAVGRDGLNPMNERSIKELKRYGHLPDVLDELQREYKSSTKIGRTALGPTWLTHRGIGVVVTRRDEIDGVRLQETEHRHNGLRAGSTWQVLVKRHSGETEVLHMPNRPQADRLIRLLTTPD